MTKRQASSRRRGKGSITSYTTKAGVRWRFQLWTPVGPEFPDGEHKHIGKGGYETADAADDAMQIARGKQRAGVDLSAAMPTVADYSRRWLDGLDLEAATVVGYRRNFTLHINPAIGDLRLDKVTASRLSKMYADLQKPDPARKRSPGGLSKNTTHKVHVCLSAMFESARDDNLLAVNPARKRKTVKAPTSKAIKREQDEMQTWTGAQLRAFLNWNRDALNDDMHAVVAHRAHRYAPVRSARVAVVRYRLRRRAGQGPARN